MSNKMTPEIRFKGFTQVWEQRKFEDFVKLSQGLQIAISKRFSSPADNRKFYITNEFLNPKSTKKYYIENPPSSVVASKEDILMTRTGNTGKVVTDVEGAFHNNFFKVTYDEKNNKLFLYYLLTSEPIQKEIVIRAGSSTIPDLSHRHFYAISVRMPKLEEQKQIGAFFKQLDDTIALHQDKLEKLKQLKKGYLQLMFPQKGKKIPRLRFAHFSQEWEQRKLGELAQFNPKSVLPDLFEYVDLESVVGTELLSYRNEKKINAPSRAQRLAKKGDIFYQTVRPYQRNNYLFDLSYENYVFSTGYAQLRPYGDSYFLLSRLQENMFVSKVLDRCTGTSYPAINSNDLAQIEVAVPPTLEEQVKIGFLFRGIDDTIALQNKKISALQKTKKLYLQKMFT